jgi:hypothetical protein
LLPSAYLDPPSPRPVDAEAPLDPLLLSSSSPIWLGVVAAVRVSTGGGRIGTAANDEVEELVVVEWDDEVDAFRWIEGDEVED